jgi:hypothetical protein
MSDVQSFANQLGWCVTSRDYLHGLQEEIKYVGHQYVQAFDELAQAEYMKELQEQMRPLLQEFISQADQVILHIDDRHHAYIDLQAKDVATQLENLQGNGG